MFAALFDPVVPPTNAVSLRCRASFGRRQEPGHLVHVHPVDRRHESGLICPATSKAVPPSAKALSPMVVSYFRSLFAARWDFSRPFDAHFTSNIQAFSHAAARDAVTVRSVRTARGD